VHIVREFVRRLRERNHWLKTVLQSQLLFVAGDADDLARFVERAELRPRFPWRSGRGNLTARGLRRTLLHSQPQKGKNIVDSSGHLCNSVHDAARNNTGDSE